jgi:hypothetical protein
VVGTANSPPGQALFLAAMNGEVNGRSAAKVGEVGLGECPPPAVPVEPALTSVLSTDCAMRGLRFL